jgi:hypothetical protein
MTQVVLGRLLHFLKDHGGDLGRGIPLSLNLYHGHAVGAIDDLVGDLLHLIGHLAQTASHEPLDGEDGLLRVGHGLALGHLSHEPFPVLGKRHHRWGGPTTFGVGDNHRIPTFHNCHDRVGRAQIDSNDFGSHVDSGKRSRCHGGAT